MRLDGRLISHLIAAAALLALPACSFQHGVASDIHFFPGPTPQSSAIFCDIEKVGGGWDNTARVCADTVSADVRNSAVPLTSAALALNTNQTSMFGLDKSAAAVARCGSEGEIVEFQGPFPQGGAECINCGTQIGPGNLYADANAACAARCEDVSKQTSTSGGLGLSDADIATFCSSHARASTNVPVTGCPMGFQGACTDGGTLLSTFTDPRQFAEPVAWTDLVGSAAGGTANNDLTRTAASTGAFDAGAVSTQRIVNGDAYVEFSAAETTLAHLIGLSVIPSGCADPCQDTDPGTHDVTFGVNLGADGHYYVVQSGVPVTTGPDVNGSFGTYSAGDRFRITVLDQGGGLINVKYSKLVGTCTPGMPCNQTVFYETNGVSGYPLRVDTSLQFPPATLQNVLLLRIIPE